MVRVISKEQGEKALVKLPLRWRITKHSCKLQCRNWIKQTMHRAELFRRLIGFFFWGGSRKSFICSLHTWVLIREIRKNKSRLFHSRVSSTSCRCVLSFRKISKSRIHNPDDNTGHCFVQNHLALVRPIFLHPKSQSWWFSTISPFHKCPFGDGSLWKKLCSKQVCEWISTPRQGLGPHEDGTLTLQGSWVNVGDQRRRPRQIFGKEKGTGNMSIVLYFGLQAGELRRLFASLEPRHRSLVNTHLFTFYLQRPWKVLFVWSDLFRHALSAQHFIHWTFRVLVLHKERGSRLLSAPGTTTTWKRALQSALQLVGCLSKWKPRNTPKSLLQREWKKTCWLCMKTFRKNHCARKILVLKVLYIFTMTNP